MVKPAFADGPLACVEVLDCCAGLGGSEVSPVTQAVVCRIRAEVAGMWRGMVRCEEVFHV